MKYVRRLISNNLVELQLFGTCRKFSLQITIGVGTPTALQLSSKVSPIFTLRNFGGVSNMVGLLQLASSPLSKQSPSPSQWKDFGIHWLTFGHLNSLSSQANPVKGEKTNTVKKMNNFMLIPIKMNDVGLFTKEMTQ